LALAASSFEGVALTTSAISEKSVKSGEIESVGFFGEVSWFKVCSIASVCDPSSVCEYAVERDSDNLVFLEVEETFFRFFEFLI